MQDPNFYADFFKGLKDNPNKVIVAAITGNPGPVTTELVANKKCPETDPKCLPAMKPSCVSSNGAADPSVRTTAFLDQFPNRSSFTTICNENLAEALTQTAQLLARVIGTPCFESDIDTTDLSDAPGLQLDCQVSDVEFPGTAEESQIPLPRCQMVDNTTPEPNQQKPCWYVFPNEDKCSNFSTGLALGTLRDEASATDLTVQAQCKSR